MGKKLHPPLVGPEARWLEKDLEIDVCSSAEDVTSQQDA